MHRASEVWYRDSMAGSEWPDVFEPDLIRDALTDMSKVTLGNLMFSEEQWEVLGQSIPQQDDPLTTLYRELGAFNNGIYYCQG